MDLLFVHCREKMDYECQLVEWLACMREKGNGLVDTTHLDYLVVSSRFDSGGLVSSHSYWAQDCAFQMQIHTNHKLTKTCVGSCKTKVLALPPCDRTKVDVLVLKYWVGWETIHLLLVPAPLELNTAPVPFMLFRGWKGTFVVGRSYRAPCVCADFIRCGPWEGVLMSNTGNRKMAMYGCDVLCLMLKHLIRSINDLGFFVIIYNTGLT